MRWEATETEQDLVSLGQMQLILQGLLARYEHHLPMRLQLDAMREGLDGAIKLLARQTVFDSSGIGVPLIN
ncbi:MAG: hypothetical protein HY342_06680 [Candidatus Lambdaproteobacteria bacterium]|nr:hypothetical protein [Candidatus Lambdaproteobacteria bacterium]